jgi:hypothetical protein
MNKNKEDVLVELQELKNNNSNIYHLTKIENQITNKAIIENNCIKSQCPNYSNIRFDDIDWHLCNDNWSGEYAQGWHCIYYETLDLCVERFE